ncbi:hypothetical protein [Pseudomonas syringae]|uniref:Uncharacterized protein n=1 Tax=Pseudomonas syringae CC1417 TaxID=1357272 RepID=A0AAU8LLX9_PSESX
MCKFLSSTSFPVHLLDDKNSRLVNPIIDAQGANRASGGYAAGLPGSTTTSTGGSQIADQTPNDYSRPVMVLPAQGVMNQDGKIAESANNGTGQNTLTNLRPGDADIAQRPVRTLVQDDSGRYWLQISTGKGITPSNLYDFIKRPDGNTRISTPNGNEDFSTHLGLSGGADVKYAGSIRFENNDGPNRGEIKSWKNNSGHYQPPATFSGNSGLSESLFNPR